MGVDFAKEPVPALPLNPSAGENAMNKMPSMTALLGLLAVAGFQNRDKIGQMLNDVMSGGAGSSGQDPTRTTAQAGESGFGHASSANSGSGGLGGLLGGGAAGGGLGGLLSSLGGGQQGGLGSLLGGLAGGAGGGMLSSGVGELINHLRQNGLGDQASSWVSRGPNQDVSPQQLGQAIDPEILATLSEKTGLSQDEIVQRLTQVLPRAVDDMTPNGQLPSPGGMSAGQGI
jgi:uncharacterized protein YidB (DUF937 family)